MKTQENYDPLAVKVTRMELKNLPIYRYIFYISFAIMFLCGLTYLLSS